MSNSDNIQRLIVYITAALLALGSLGLAVYVWTNAGDRDIALIFGFLGTAFGSASTFLFLGERSTAAVKAADRSHEAGVMAGLATPEHPLGVIGDFPDSPVNDEFPGDTEEEIATNPPA